jgi:hypothetical protein
MSLDLRGTFSAVHAGVFFPEIAAGHALQEGRHQMLQNPWKQAYITYQKQAHYQHQDALAKRENAVMNLHTWPIFQDSI